MHLRKWVRLQGKHPQTSCQRFREEEPPDLAQKLGRVIMGEEANAETTVAGRSPICGAVVPSIRRRVLSMRRHTTRQQRS